MKKFLYPSALIIVFFLVLFSCRKNTSDVVSVSPQFSIADAQAWFSRQAKVKDGSVDKWVYAKLIKNLPENQKQLNWNRAMQKKNKQVEAVEIPYNGTAVVYELPDSSYKNAAERDRMIAGTAKRAVIYKKPNGIIERMLVHIVPSASYAAANPGNNKENSFLTLKNDFTGWIYTYDWNENPKSISEIKNGKLIKGSNRVVRDSSLQTGAGRYEYWCNHICTPVYIGTMGANCGQPGDPYYDDCVYNSQAGTGSWTNYCRWECGYIWIPDTPGNGDNGGNGSGNPPDDCNYYGTCNTQTDEDVVKDISVELTNPCFQKAVNRINTADALGTDIGFILHQAFTFWIPRDLHIKQRCISDTTIDGQTNPSTGLIVVTFNECALHNASQEYIAATLYHEILHAYFAADGRRIDEHEEIALIYLDALKMTLMSHFPSLNAADAEALAWGGLGETQAWKTLQSNDPGRALDILNVNRQHKRGQNGTPCSVTNPPDGGGSGGQMH